MAVNMNIMSFVFITPTKIVLFLLGCRKEGVSFSNFKCFADKNVIYIIF
jgi:hypothetical protein